jgi:hypothetical protein
MAVRSVCHRIAWTEAIKLEWDKHDSRFARQWRLSMVRLKKLKPLDKAIASTIRESIQEHCKDGDVLAIVLKDCHLIEAAVAADSRVASLDEQVRGHLAALAVAVEVLPGILWVNPAVVKERGVEWLNQGAPDERARRLRKK